MERPFGPYRLVRQIAVGGMAEIHLAKTRGIAGFEKYVALKMIHPNFAQDEQFIEMLIDEAKIAVQLQHVNIAQTFDLGRVGETYYITMEFVDGADLYKILRRGSEQDLDVPLDVCAFVAKEMATGLDYAHRKRGVGGDSLGIVHRDVSPQNVLVSHAGEVKLVDFGIAKATMKVRQTAVGVIKGKYYYMSPEQSWGERLDHRSDIFSAGIVLYEMLTGQMLYLEEDLHKLLEMVRRAAIAPPSRLRKGIPPQLERIVMHALAKRADDRYQNAGDMAADLERFLHTYSPVFTASKLAAHLRKVLGDPMAAPAPAPVRAPAEPLPRDPRLSTQPIERDELLRERSELHDENSVIFRIDELRGRPDDSGERPLDAVAEPDVVRPRDPEDGTRPLRVPDLSREARGKAGGHGPRDGRQATVPVGWEDEDERARPPRRGFAPASTMSLSDDDLGEAEEMTTVSGPPGFAGAATSTEPSNEPPWTRARTWDLSDGAGEGEGDFEPTVVESAPRPETRPAARPETRPAEPSDRNDDEGPTQTRDPDLATSELPASRRADEPRPHAERGRAPRGPAHPALAARTPTPHVSELRRPRASRRTPIGGSPQASVLQALVGGQASEPLPTRPVRGGGAPSDGVPAQVPEEVEISSPTGPVGGRGGVPVPASTESERPSAPAIPGVIDLARLQAEHGMAPPSSIETLPPHLQPYGLPAAAQMISPAAPYSDASSAVPSALPLGAPLDTPPPFMAYGHQPVSFTKQLAALEVDEIPAHLRLSQGRANWVLRALLAAVIVVGGVAGGMIFLRATDQAAPTASLVIESVPGGATVTIDGERLRDTTPVPYATTAPGARHEIKVELARHRRWTQTIVVPRRGGEVRVMAFLTEASVRLRVVSTPAGAEVYINGALKGYTPMTLAELDPDVTRSIELRLKDYAPEIRPLDWAGRTDLDVDVKFRR